MRMLGFVIGFLVLEYLAWTFGVFQLLELDAMFGEWLT